MKFFHVYFFSSSNLSKYYFKQVCDYKYEFVIYETFWDNYLQLKLIPIYMKITLLEIQVNHMGSRERKAN